MIGGRAMFYQPFNPRQLSGLVLWLDGTNVNANGSNPVDGNAISQWVDKSGNGNNALQATGSAQPKFMLNSISSTRPAVVFDGVSQIMKGNIAGLAANPDITAFIVAQFVGVVASGNATLCGMGSVDASAGSFGLANQTATFFNCYQWSGRESRVTPSDANAHFFKTTYSSSTHLPTLVVGNTTGTGTLGAVTLNLDTVFSVGGHSNVNFPFYAHAKIGEIAIYNRTLTSTEEAVVKTYLSNKWGI